MSRPRKYTFEKSREQAELILQAYEAGMKPKDLAMQFKLNAGVNVWAKIKNARKWRARQAQGTQE